MHTRTVMLIPDGEVGWSNLRTALASLPDVQIVGEATDAEDALAIAQEHRPDHIFAATVVAGETTLPLLIALRQIAPASRILRFAPRFDPADLAPHAAFGAAGYLLWHDLSCQGLRACVEATLAGRVHLTSQIAVDAFTAALRDPSLLHGDVHLTDRERSVLHRLAAGQTQTQIAASEHLSEKTVKRTVESLREKLDAPSQFTLGMRAAQLGLVAPKQ